MCFVISIISKLKNGFLTPFFIVGRGFVLQVIFIVCSEGLGGGVCLCVICI